MTAEKSWSEDLAEHLLKSSCILLLLSGDSVHSHYVMKEIDLAISHEKYIIPVYIKKCAIPFTMKFMFGNLQIAMDLYKEADEDKRYEALKGLLPITVFAKKKIPHGE